MLALTLASRHSWTSPGRIRIVGFSWPLTVRVVAAPMVTPWVLIASPSSWKSFSAMMCWVMWRRSGGRYCVSPWGSLAYFALQPASSSPGALGTILTGMKDSEPGWISSIDGALAHAVAHLGTQVSVTIAVLCALAGATVALGRFTRLGVLIAATVGAVIWLAEVFGAICTGQGTDPTSGLLLIVAAAAFWPFADVPPREADHARLTSATRARTRWASPSARAPRSATKRLVAPSVQTGRTRREIPG